MLRFSLWTPLLVCGVACSDGSSDQPTVVPVSSDGTPGTGGAAGSGGGVGANSGTGGDVLPPSVTNPPRPYVEEPPVFDCGEAVSLCESASQYVYDGATGYDEFTLCIIETFADSSPEGFHEITIPGVEGDVSRSTSLWFDLSTRVVIVKSGSHSVYGDRSYSQHRCQLVDPDFFTACLADYGPACVQQMSWMDECANAPEVTGELCP